MITYASWFWRLTISINTRNDFHQGTVESLLQKCRQAGTLLFHFCTNANPFPASADHSLQVITFAGQQVKGEAATSRQVILRSLALLLHSFQKSCGVRSADGAPSFMSIHRWKHPLAQRHQLLIALNHMGSCTRVSWQLHAYWLSQLVIREPYVCHCFSFGMDIKTVEHSTWTIVLVHQQLSGLQGLLVCKLASEEIFQNLICPFVDSQGGVLLDFQQLSNPCWLHGSLLCFWQYALFAKTFLWEINPWHMCFLMSLNCSCATCFNCWHILKATCCNHILFEWHEGQTCMHTMCWALEGFVLSLWRLLVEPLKARCWALKAICWAFEGYRCWAFEG